MYFFISSPFLPFNTTGIGLGYCYNLIIIYIFWESHSFCTTEAEFQAAIKIREAISQDPRILLLLSWVTFMGDYETCVWDFVVCMGAGRYRLLLGFLHFNSVCGLGLRCEQKTEDVIEWSPLPDNFTVLPCIISPSSPASSPPPPPFSFLPLPTPSFQSYSSLSSVLKATFLENPNHLSVGYFTFISLTVNLCSL